MFNKILLPIDLSETKLAAEALKIAIDECRKNNAELHVLMVVPGFRLSPVGTYLPEGTMKKMHEQVSADLHKFIEKNIPKDIKSFSDLISGEPAEEIIEAAEKLGVGLVVIPSHSRTIGQILLGSTANKVVAHAHCPVMVVKTKTKKD